jgi:hypothetical protein
MTCLLDEVIDAHGGLERWGQLDQVHAHLIQGGVIWALKGHPGQLTDVFVSAKLHEQWVSHEPFRAPNLRSIYTPDQVIIEETNGRPDESLESPRETFAGHTLETHWTNLQLVYFVGISMWTYLTQPFTYTLPGFETAEIEPLEEQGDRWRRLRVTWPKRPVGHSKVQTLYVGDHGLIRCCDYEIDIAGGAPGAHLLDGYTDIAGIMVPGRHTIFARDDQDNILPDPLVVSIDVDQVEFEER